MNSEPTTTTDKLEHHNRQQLSALIDGELEADTARFLLRRLQHDETLAGCHERWQLLGDVLRGAACAPAPTDFATRVSAAIAAAPAAAVGGDAVRAQRPAWRWGGGAVVAASVAALALFVSRERLPQSPIDPSPVLEPMPVLAVEARLAPIPAAAGEGRRDGRSAVAAAPTRALVAAAPRRPDRLAARHQRAAQERATRQREVETALAQAAVRVPASPQAVDPFSHPATHPSRPWPRSVLGGDSAFSASLRSASSAAPFYPFEPRLPLSSVAPAPAPAPVPEDLPPLPQP